ncbi:hypothetical protein [Gimesia maris]|uniref:Uncharacterized protein n=2 Tax=Gimesia maris TaxID=122 RepID=A0ABX5YVJ8_9PLAN|nr:hypothetical protein [Gimesia maris]MAC52568.1 hypothetical protein [Gimesia sp.]EDL61296.1 hypothetical protein PM8797T_12368 [Gimesia maris DSM 8797]QDT81878.1 hypothetical protein Mal35_53630 [Gimesia maris]QDU17631.1 hypothetical protein CA11_54740 [Gimesia maris]QEG19657.1 hypothetical protein GmarT_55580 [Gimesia maris]|tara:strand:+ start:504 stop:980 length:477 start_codon:yes stop_codon:yes gene_type:complete
MARKSPSRLEMRRQAEAAEAESKSSPKKKATKKKKATRKKKAAKAEVRRRLFWGVFTGSMKEESRFAYDQRDAAVERIEQLRLKNAKKLYFIQPIKESLDGEVVVPKVPVDDADDIETDEVAKVEDDDDIDVVDDEVEDVEEIDEVADDDEDLDEDLD